MKSEILRLLKETEGFMSGQELCERFGVSRTAVWKAVKQLEAEGQEIEAVRNRGYRLRRSTDILTKAELESSMDTVWAGRNILYFEETESTNTEAKRAAESGAPAGTLAVADCQLSGKGRRGRSWSSPGGVGIWMSLVMRPGLHPGCASMLTLVAAMAVSAGIRQSTGLKTSIKWPNDIVSGKRKVCGILTEMSTEMECINYVVIGIGINANTKDFPDEIKETATSLSQETGKEVRRSQVIAAVMKEFERLYDVFMRTGDMSELVEEYNEALINKDNMVKVLAPQGEYTGVSLGIDKEGELLVKTEDGQVRRVISGEVSVRGIYGYV